MYCILVPSVAVGLPFRHETRCFYCPNAAHPLVWICVLESIQSTYGNKGCVILVVSLLKLTLSTESLPPCMHLT